MYHFRKCKFRGKSVSDDKWVIGELVDRMFDESSDEDDDFVCIQTDYLGDTLSKYPEPTCVTSMMYPVKPETIGQFVCEDKTGGPVFEGDYVKTCTGRICVVTYLSSPSHQGFDLRAIDNLNCPPPLKYKLWEGLEVVGNHWDGFGPNVYTEMSDKT